MDTGKSEWGEYSKVISYLISEVNWFKSCLGTRDDLLRIQDLVLNDSVAITTWAQVVERAARKAVDAVSLKDLLKARQYAEAVLETLQKFKSQGSTQEELIQILRQLELNDLAGI